VAAYNPIALGLVNRADPGTIRLAVPIVAALTLLTMLGGVWFIVRPRIESRLPFLRRHAMVVDTMTLLFFMALITEQVSNSGATRHSMWLYYAFVIVFAASYLPRMFTPVFGVLSSVCVLFGSWVSGTLDAISARPTRCSRPWRRRRRRLPSRPSGLVPSPSWSPPSARWPNASRTRSPNSASADRAPADRPAGLERSGVHFPTAAPLGPDWDHDRAGRVT
jgi:hypothetical protein